MENDNGRAKLVACAISKAVCELMSKGYEVTVNATVARLEAYRLSEEDFLRAGVFRDAALMVKNGKF